MRGNLTGFTMGLVRFSGQMNWLVQKEQRSAGIHPSPKGECCQEHSQSHSLVHALIPKARAESVRRVIKWKASHYVQRRDALSPSVRSSHLL
jgi:hypothetical protein